jgi:nucleoside-diphosphate-sugar epimerase
MVKLNILITGSDGFLGSNLFNSLKTKYNVFEGNRKTINLLSRENIENFIVQNNINAVLHCAIQGGNRLCEDDIEIVYNNLLISENLLYFTDKYELFINFASGAEFDRSINIENAPESFLYQRIPKDYYGLSKNIIAKRMNETYPICNFRLFGCFNHNEKDSRFIKSGIIKTKKKEPIIIHQDKYMDFIYFDDVVSTVMNYLDDCEHEKFYMSHDINLCYEKKYKLSDIANIINSFSSYKSEIIIENAACGLNYTGDSKNFMKTFPKLKGLELGIKECYDKIIL